MTAPATLIVRQTDLTVYQGEDWTEAFPVLDANNRPVTVTGWTARVQVRARPDALPVFHEWSPALGNLSVGSTSVTLTVPGAVSLLWTWRVGYYDFPLTTPAGAVARIARGMIHVVPAVTR